MSNNVVTLTGTVLKTTWTPPTLRSSTCEITVLSRDLVPLNNCLLNIEDAMVTLMVEAARLSAFLDGQEDEVAERIFEIVERAERVVGGDDE